MTTLVKLIIGILLSFLLTNNETNVPIKEYALFFESTPTTVSTTTKSKAFQILANKYNACHCKRSKRRIFTLEKTNPWAANIYKHFINKRMPKGNKIKHPGEEYQELSTWITSTKNEI